MTVPEQWEGEDYIIASLGLMLHKRDRLEAQRIARIVLKFARSNWLKTSPQGDTVRTVDFLLDLQKRIDEHLSIASSNPTK